MSELIIAESTDTQVALALVIDQEGVGGVTGLSPTVAIRESTTTDSYFDFNDSTFKTSGWTTKYQAMVDVERGHYSFVLNLPTLTPALGETYILEYHVDDGGSIVGDDSDKLLVVASIADIPGDVWDEATSAHTIAGTFGVEAISGLTPTQAAQILDIYRVLGLDPTEPLLVSKTSRTSGTINQTIQENVPTAGTVTVTRA